ncbi:MAG: EscU/YscU/HrcU family type III secretion system export apparatus switch protein [Magnetococcales bacterium]|nr:EscU/YscU/HrcU family type III secretion system export apparatus switch protein [Magnetococcales bacterium]
MADSRRKSPPNSMKQAVALRYVRGQDSAPRVTATGRGRIAETILDRAREAGVSLVEDPDLVSLLGKVELGETVPPELYKAVAEVLAFVYKINKRYPVPQDDGTL